MTLVKEQMQTNKVKRDKRIDANSKKLKLKESNPMHSNSSNHVGNEQLKEQSKISRRPKSGKSL